MVITSYFRQWIKTYSHCVYLIWYNIIWYFIFELLYVCIMFHEHIVRTSLFGSSFPWWSETPNALLRAGNIVHALRNAVDAHESKGAADSDSKIFELSKHNTKGTYQNDPQPTVYVSEILSCGDERGFMRYAPGECLDEICNMWSVHLWRFNVCCCQVVHNTYRWFVTFLSACKKHVIVFWGCLRVLLFLHP